MFVEPDAHEASRLLALYPREQVIGSALWSQAGTASLHVTRQPGCSSLLPPDPDDRMPVPIKEMLAVEKQIDVPVERADTVLQRLGITSEVLKIDVQGGELEVLRGFGSLLCDLYCCELEVSFMRVYRAPPLFQDIYEFFADAGFGLFDLKVFGVAGARNGVQANAFFCRRGIRSERQVIVERIFCKANGFGCWA